MDNKAHGKHNEDACEFLLEDGRYCDWVVTTAFYSALHYIVNEIFPKEISGIEYDSFEKYYNQRYRKDRNRPSKHTATINLVKSEIGDQAHQIYDWLFGLCMTARYRDYKTHPFIAQEASKRLLRLKSYLKK